MATIKIIKIKKSIPLHQIKEISFDHVEIITRKVLKKFHIKKLKNYNKIKKKIKCRY